MPIEFVVVVEGYGKIEGIEGMQNTALMTAIWTFLAVADNEILGDKEEGLLD